MRLSSAKGSRLLVNRARARPRPRARNERATPKGVEDHPTLLTAIRDRFSLVFHV
jgi:hypothetical protein